MEEENKENLGFKFVRSGIDQQPGNLTIFQKVHMVNMNQVECVAYL